jgi:hypothetical protein
LGVPVANNEANTKMVVTMSRFTFGFLLGAGAGWAVGSGKAAEWKRDLDERRTVGTGGPQLAGMHAGMHAVGETANDIAPEYGLPNDAAAR